MKASLFAVCGVFVSIFALPVSAQFSNQITQLRPIQLGTSGGTLGDQSLNPLGCCSGTLGALVTDGVDFYILSNNHAISRTNKGRRGEIITQPGLVDADCLLGPGNEVARLTRFVRIHRRGKNRIDGAVAQISGSGVVDTTGAIIGIGQASSETVVPLLGSAVKKSGRTTGLTRGIVAAVDGTVVVNYKRCFAPNRKAFPARFVGQIIITPSTFGNFADHGDSGSLVVEDVDDCPRPVGLLFAGATSAVAANPINTVLNELGARAGVSFSVVGCPAPDDVIVARPAAKASRSYQRAAEAKSKHEEKLLNIHGVAGVAIGLNSADAGQAQLTVLVEEDTESLRQQLSAATDGAEYSVLVTGPFSVR